MNKMNIESVNPVNSFGEEQYAAIWQKLFSTFLAGFWGRAFFVAFVVLALFFGVRRRNPRVAAIFMIIASLIAFGAGILDMLNIY